MSTGDTETNKVIIKLDPSLQDTVEIVEVGSNPTIYLIKPKDPSTQLPPVESPPSPAQPDKPETIPPPSQGPPVMGTVAVVNISSMVKDADLEQWMTDIKTQADQHIVKFWDYTFNFVMVPPKVIPPVSDWYMLIADDIDAANAAGYHDVGKNGKPIIKIDASFKPVSVTISHEIAETISDPMADEIVANCVDKTKPPPYKTCFMYKENADASENDTYQVGSTTVSNFVSKNWFIQQSQGPYDYLGLINAPFIIRPGGYMAVCYSDPNKPNEWTNIYNQERISPREQCHKNEFSRHRIYRKKIRNEPLKMSTFEVDTGWDVRTNKEDGTRWP